jgi:hypothetical protein
MYNYVFTTRHLRSRHCAALAGSLPASRTLVCALYNFQLTLSSCVL